MIHTFYVTYEIDGQLQARQEMTFSDDEIRMTLRRRIQTAFPKATNIQLTRKPEEQLSLSAGEKPKKP